MLVCVCVVLTVLSNVGLVILGRASVVVSRPVVCLSCFLRWVCSFRVRWVMVCTCCCCLYVWTG